MKIVRRYALTIIVMCLTITGLAQFIGRSQMSLLNDSAIASTLVGACPDDSVMTSNCSNLAASCENNDDWSYEVETTKIGYCLCLYDYANNPDYVVTCSEDIEENCSRYIFYSLPDCAGTPNPQSWDEKPTECTLTYVPEQ